MAQQLREGVKARYLIPAIVLATIIIYFQRVFIYSLIDSLGSWPTFLIMLFLAMSLLYVFALWTTVFTECRLVSSKAHALGYPLIFTLAVVAVNGVVFSLERVTGVEDLFEDFVKWLMVVAPFLASWMLMMVIFSLISKKLSLCQNRKNVP